MIKKKYQLRELLEKYKAEEVCLKAILEARAKHDCNCPICGSNILFNYKRIKSRKGFQCQKCSNQIFPLVGTPFEHSHLNLRDIFEVLINKIITKGYSASELELHYGFNSYTVWTLMGRIRKWMRLSESKDKLSGYVEIDETAIITGTKGLGRKIKRKRGFSSERVTIFLTMIERGSGKVKAFRIDDRTEQTLLAVIKENIELESTILTDDWGGYANLKYNGYKHYSVNHSNKEFKKGIACTNTVEGFFGNLKPFITSTYRMVSERHSDDYMYEFIFRYNNRRLSHEEKLQKLLDALPPLFTESEIKQAA